MSSTIGERFKQVRKQRGLTQSEMAQLLTAAQSTLSQIEAGRSMPGFELLQRMLEQVEGLDASWLLLGHGEMFNGHTPSPTMVPLVDVEASAGYIDEAREPNYLEALEHFRVPGLPHDGVGACLFEVSGDSMMPTLQHGDFVAATPLRVVAPIQDDALAVVVSSEGVFVKRVTTIGDELGGVILRSDNPSYPPQVIALDEIIEFWRVEMRLSRAIDGFVQRTTLRLMSIESDLKILRRDLDTLLRHDLKT